MAKATFKRNKETGGYNARRRVEDRLFEAHFAKSGKQWYIESGDFARDNRWVKLSDLKIEWSALCDSEANPLTAPSVSAGPPALAGPPRLGPPAMGSVMGGPPAVGGPPPVGKPASPTPPQQIRGELSALGKNNHQNADPDKFAEFLKGRGVLLGPCTGGGVNDFRCEECGAHVSDWERKGHDEFLPPCRCNRTHTNPAAFLPLWSDPMFWWFTPSPDLYMRPTPIGALDMMYNWMLAHKADCSFNGTLIDPFKTILSTLYAETARPEYDPEKWSKG